MPAHILVTCSDEDPESEKTAALLCGFGKREITPPIGTPIVGYYRQRFAKGVIDPLFVRAALFQSGETRALVLTVDVCILERAWADRIREKCRYNRNAKAVFAEICNEAINQCLSRTVITSVTTLFAIVALFAFGDGSIFDFALTMLIGVAAGTYSSIFIATPIMVWWYRGKLPEFEAEEKPSKEA